MFILNPHWVTEGIYKLLNSNALSKQKGEYKYHQLRLILDLKRYPFETHGFLCNLMRKFELCFTFADDDDRYLVPELLDKQQPREADAFEPTQCLNFAYRYPILPEGLLPRFIVRSHVLSTGQPRWRTGVVLRFEGNRALVKADVQDKIVSINVAGEQSGRRRLLAIIRSDFEHIHRSFTFKAEEMIPIPDYPDVSISYDALKLWEQDGRTVYTVPVRASGPILDLSVHDLLNGVDLEGTRRNARDKNRQSEALRLFYSYSHHDERLRDELETHLKLLQRRGLIEPWYDRHIKAGNAWGQYIDHNLERADLILLLVSADFMASEYCLKEEHRALERTSRTHSHKPLNLLTIFSIEHIDLKNN